MNSWPVISGNNRANGCIFMFFAFFGLMFLFFITQIAYALCFELFIEPCFYLVNVEAHFSRSQFQVRAALPQKAVHGSFAYPYQRGNVLFVGVCRRYD